MLSYIGSTTINGFPGIEKVQVKAFQKPSALSDSISDSFPDGTKQILEHKGAEGLAQWIQEQRTFYLPIRHFGTAINLSWLQE